MKPEIKVAQGLFDHIKNRTPCPFANNAKFYVYKAKIISDDFRINFSNFCRLETKNDWDGYALELPDKYGKTIKNLATTCRSILSNLSGDDFFKGIETPEWEFEYQGIHFFVMGFGSCYSSNHSRQTYGRKGCLFLFHLMEALERKNCPRSEKEELRKLIASKYASEGMLYERSDIHSVELEAPRYITPATLSDPVVEWWNKSST